MIKHPIRKFLGLSVIYSLIILGIFLLQFRSETAISQTFGDLRIHLVETQTDSQQKRLKSNFQSTYQGLTLFADDQEPVIITRDDGSESVIHLLNWQEDSPTTFTLFFEQDVSLRFSVTPDKTQNFMSLEARLPDSVENLSIPYKPSSGYLVTDQSDKRAVISSKSQEFEAMAAEVTPKRITMTHREQVATYSSFTPTDTFDFSLASGIPLSAETTFAETLSKFKADFIQLAAQAISETPSEQLVVAYIAAMAENRQYREAIAEIPSSFKNSNRRTYLSTPYFNSLVSMNASLVRHMENRASMVVYAVQQQSLDIFTIQDLAELLCTMEGNDEVAELLSLPATMTDFAPSPAQAAGIIGTYTKLHPLNRTMAESLRPVLNHCLSIIASSCRIENNVIRLEEKNAPLSLRDSVSVGMALVAYGQLTGNMDYKTTGYLIINSYLTSEVSSNIHSMTDLYPILVPQNTYYPHIHIIANASASGNNKPVWAWTIAKATSYSRESNGDITLTFDFSVDETHYTIINGIRPFVGIDIYDIPFRTDPRFESYNSSGYAYNAETQTMFLKSLHKVQKEKIRLHYNTPTARAGADSMQETTMTAAATVTGPSAQDNNLVVLNSSQPNS